MFDFERLDVYNAAKNLNIKVIQELQKNSQIDPFLKDQWKRAWTSIVLNLAEGIERWTKGDKGHFYTMARGSVFESVSILNLVKDLGLINSETYQEFYAKYKELSKMLIALKKALK